MIDVWTPLKLRSANEGIIFEGEASGPGGGGSTERGSYTFELDDLSGPAACPFVYELGDALLDLTDPTSPKIIAAGIYAVTLVVSTIGATGVPTDTFTAGMSLARGVPIPGPEPGQVYPMVTNASTSLAATWYFNATDSIEANVTNNAATPVTFVGELTLQRIT